MPGQDYGADWVVKARRYAVAHQALDAIETAALLEPHAPPQPQPPPAGPGPPRSGPGPSRRPAGAAGGAGAGTPAATRPAGQARYTSISA